MNKVIMIGNLCRPPEAKITSSGTTIAEINIANNRKRNDKEGKVHEEVCFVNVVAFGKQAENAEKFLAKGSKVLIEGRLAYDEWDDKETGKKRSKHKIIAENITYLSKPAEKTDAPDVKNDDIPF